MKKLYTLTLLFLICAFHSSGQYVTVWKTDNDGTSASNQITIPATGTNYNITWEEVGVPANIGTATGSGNYTLTFPSEGIYQVSITPGTGTFTRISFAQQIDCAKLLEIKQWGDIQWESMEYAYLGCYNMTVTATDIPDLQKVTSTGSMFSLCSMITDMPNIDNWDVSTITDMQLMFGGSGFNGAIGSWNVSNVTTMYGMFSQARNFNQQIGSWDVSKVTNMAGMFNYASNFNQPIGTWNVGSVTSMAIMFEEAVTFNQPLSDWDVGRVTNMGGMFHNAFNFNQPLDRWDLRNVEYMNGMFLFASNFNQPIDSWNVSNVTNMELLFAHATSFDQPLDSWDVSKVTNMYTMFGDAVAFNHPIGSWNVGNVLDMSYMFEGAMSFNQPVNDWDVSQVGTMQNMFLRASKFNQPVNDWDVSQVTNMGYMFAWAESFNQPVNNWNVSQVEPMYGMFYNATAFNQSLSDWTMTSVYTMFDMLSGAAIDCANMARTLQGWAENPATPDNIAFHAAGITYGLQAAAALETLRTAKGWTITIGDGVVCAPLEVSLVNFTAKIIGGNVKLEWATASETDNNYFDVERSADARSWNPVGRIKGAGTVNTERNYFLTDRNPLEGNSYYRLKIVDLAGKADYSNIRAVNVKTGSAFNIYPNPATTSLTLSGKINGAVKIYNLSGQQVLKTEIKTEKTQIPLNGLPAGAYVIKSESGWNSKFFKN